MKILFENKQLNEGPGAGYTVSGTLTNVKINNITNLEQSGVDTYGVYYTVELDATATFEDVTARSYYYSGNAGDVTVKIYRARIVGEEGINPTHEDIVYAIDGAKIEASIGGGWSHSTFDGIIDVNYNSIDNADNLDSILFEILDNAVVGYLDKAVQGENIETLYAVMENNWLEETFTSKEEAIKYAKANDYDRVQRVFLTSSFDDEEDIEFEDVVWTNDSVDESLQENIDKKDGKTLPKDIQKSVISLLRTSNTLFSEKNMPYATDDELVSIVDDFIKLKDRLMRYRNNDSSKSLTESFDENDRIQALANYLGIEASEISNTYGNEFETPEGDYLVVTEDEARELAEDDIRNLFDELGLESFTPDFKDWIIRNALDNDWFEGAVRESYEFYVEDIEDEASSMGYDNRLIEEMHDYQVLSDEDFEEGEDGEPDLGELKEGVDIDSLKEEFIDLLVENAGDPVDYCGDNFGWDWVSEMATTHDLIDMDEVVEQSIYVDGIAHFIATYDGDEIELENGLYAYRTN